MHHQFYRRLFFFFLVINSVSFCFGNETSELNRTVVDTAQLEIIPDTIKICAGESATIAAITSTGGVGLSWSPTDSLTIVDAENVAVNPVVSSWYFATLDVPNCILTDSVFIQVDSIPYMTQIEAIPVKEMYCEGEIVSLTSPNFELAFFPDIEFLWQPSTGAQSDDTLYNLAIVATVSETYIRTITNNACVQMDTIDLTVIPVADITVTPESSVICPGEEVQLLATSDDQVDAWTWSPEVGLSCIECPDPAATPPSSITYQVQAEFMGCPSFAQATVEVLTTPDIVFPDPPFVCVGESIVLNEMDDPDVTYSWQDETGNTFSNDAQPVVSPSQTTTYTVTASKSGCEPITESVTIIVQEDYNVNVQDLFFACANVEIDLEVSSSDPNVTFNWEDGNGNVLVPPFPPGFFPAGSVQNLFFDASDPAGCFIKTGMITIEVYPDFSLTVSEDQSITAGETVTVSATADLAGVSFIWTNSADEIVSAESTFSITLCNSETFLVEANDEAGCYLKSDTVRIEVMAGFAADELILVQMDSIDKLFEGEEIMLEVITTPEELPNATYEWLVNGEIVSTTSNPVSNEIILPELALGVELEEIIFEVNVISNNGCIQMAPQINTSICDNPVAAPNVFTPNGDSVNDVFSLVSRVPVDFLEFRVWDRWGKLVFENENGSDQWDGKIDDKDALSDVYVYKIQYTIRGGDNVFVESGDVTLLR